MLVPSALAVDPNPSYQDKGDFYLTYEPTEDFQEYEDWLKAEQYFEIQIPFLNETFKLPHDVDIIIAECGEANAYYFQGQIIMCYEFINQTDYRFANYFDIVYGEGNWTTEDLNYSVINVIENVLYHEMGHALIEIYELPTTGPEESVADQFSAFILLEFPYGDDDQWPEKRCGASIAPYARTLDPQPSTGVWCRCIDHRHRPVFKRGHRRHHRLCERGAT